MTQQVLLKRVLVVDDNQAAADILVEMLVLSGYAAVCAYDGAAAVQLARRYQPHAILLDLGMPCMDGFAVAATLRLEPEFAATLIVALTAWGDAATRERTRHGGFDAHLVKPAALETILAALTPAQGRAKPG